MCFLSAIVWVLASDNTLSWWSWWCLICPCTQSMMDLLQCGPLVSYTSEKWHHNNAFHSYSVHSRKLQRRASGPSDSEAVETFEGYFNQV
jgi:hypothetical protein